MIIFFKRYINYFDDDFWILINGANCNCFRDVFILTKDEHCASNEVPRKTDSTPSKVTTSKRVSLHASIDGVITEMNLSCIYFFEN